MRLEDQVCSLELAKRLKELGVKQESVFFYRCYKNVGYGIWQADQMTKELTEGVEWYSAFTVTELGEMLPQAIKSYRVSNVWHCSEMTTLADPQPAIGFHADTEADARAKMLIYLIEQGLVKTDGGKND